MSHSRSCSSWWWRGQAFTAAGYNDLGNSLPGLLAAAEATRESAAGRARQQANAVLARAYVMASELAAKQHSDAAWVAADRALAAARASGMPIPVGEAARVLAITMRRSGNCSSAVRFLATEAAALDPAQERTGAVRTTLLLTAAYSAAAGGDRATRSLCSTKLMRPSSAARGPPAGCSPSMPPRSRPPFTASAFTTPSAPRTKAWRSHGA
ncbi:hypothetical protein [Streptomyces goshikiensis]|uniref:hypothetical protein n=1 Tax=Streptomyces goshikiensis TaxID=1942 RepID=UPI003650846B